MVKLIALVLALVAWPALGVWIVVAAAVAASALAVSATLRGGV